MSITLDPTQLDSLFNDIGSIVENTDYGPVLENFREVSPQGEPTTCDGQPTPGRGPGVPLAESTVRRKRHNGILFESEDQIESLVTVGGAGNLNSTKSHRSLFEEDANFAFFRDAGTNPMPARPPSGLNQESVDELAERVVNVTIESMRNL